MRNQAVENDDLLDAPPTEMIKDNSTPDEGYDDDAKEMEATKDQIAYDESKNKLPGNLAPEPPRWRFVKEAKSTLGYSSKYAGVVISGKSSTELGADYIAPEISKDVKVRTIEQFDLVAPEHELDQKKDKEVGQLLIREWDTETEDFVGEGGLRHHSERSSIPAPDSNRWKPNFSPTPGVATFARKDGGESFGYENDRDIPPFETDRVLGKLHFDPPDADDNNEEFNGEIPKRTHAESSFTATYNSPYDDSHMYSDRSMASNDAATSNGEGPDEYNHDDFDYLDENGKPLSLHSSPDSRQQNWKRYRWLLLLLLLLFIIIGAVVGKKRSSEGNDVPSSMLPERFVYGGGVTSLPSQFPTTVFLDPADTNASPLFSRPTFPPTDQPSLIPSVTSLPSATPSILPSTAPSGEPSSNPTARPSATPSFDPTLLPSTSPTSEPSVLPSNSPSVSPTQLPSRSSSPTIMGSVEPSLSLKPSPSPSHRPSSHPSSYPSVHPITMSPSKQPIMFMGGCPEPFEPFTSYIIDQRVSRDGVIYMCISTICGSLLYTPGLDSGQWREAWEIVGACNGTNSPTLTPSQFPSIAPTSIPSTSLIPTQQPSSKASAVPSIMESETPSIIASTVVPSINPTFNPSNAPSPNPTLQPSPLTSTVVPTGNPTPNPSKAPSPNPTLQPSPLTSTVVPTFNPTPNPSKAPSPKPTLQPSDEPTTKRPTPSPTRRPTLKPVVAPTPRPTCPPQNGNFNLCIALDMSGSVCGGGQCNFCQPLSACNSFGINQQRCCNNFDNVLEFSKALVRALGDLKTQQDFSLVHFASDAEIASTLQNANQAIKTLQQLDYTGGATNLAGGITLCQQTLDSSAAGRKNFMVIVTDGYPSVPSERPRPVTVKAANAAKDKGTFMIPIFVEQTGLNDPAVALMKEISSDGQVFLTDFGSIVSLKDIVFEQVICNA